MSSQSNAPDSTGGGVASFYNAPDSTEPTEPTKPTEPTEPTEPNEPTEPTDPTAQAGLTDPTDPTGPNDPTGPTDPIDPTDPTGPTDPSDQPIQPPRQAQPIQPIQPAQTIQPAQPIQPIQPTQQAQPIRAADRSNRPNRPNRSERPTDPSDRHTAAKFVALHELIHKNGLPFLLIRPADFALFFAKVLKKKLQSFEKKIAKLWKFFCKVQFYFLKSSQASTDIRTAQKISKCSILLLTSMVPWKLVRNEAQNHRTRWTIFAKKKSKVRKKKGESWRKKKWKLSWNFRNIFHAQPGISLWHFNTKNMSEQQKKKFGAAKKSGVVGIRTQDLPGGTNRKKKGESLRKKKWRLSWNFRNIFQAQPGISLWHFNTKNISEQQKKNLEQQKKVAWLGFEPKTFRAGPFGPRAPAVVARLKLEKKKKLARVGFEPKASRA
jgi:hypothetical protein